MKQVSKQLHMLFIVLLAVAVAALLFYAQTKSTPGKPPIVSGFGSIPVLSPLIALATNPRDLFIYCSKKYEEHGIARITFFNLFNFNIVFGTPVVEAFFKAPESDLSLGKAAEFAVGPLLGLEPESNPMKAEAKNSNAWIKEAIMRSDQLDYMSHIARDHVNKFFENLPSNKFDLFREIYNLIVTINIYCFVGRDCADYAQEMCDVLWTIEYFGTNTQSIFNPYSSQRKKSVAARLRLTEIIGILRERRIQNIKEGKYSIDQDGRDVLQVNIDMGKTDAEIVMALLGIFFAAQTNTVSTTCWTIAYMGEWPEWQEKARAEVKEKIGDKTDPTNDELKDLNAIGACLSETVRRNAVAFLFRKAMKNLKLGEYKLSKGDYAVVSPSVQHYNEKVFPEPEKWLPERFAGDYQTTAQRFGKNFVQWGFYSHRCLGEHFANMVMRIVLVKLLQNYIISIDKLSGLDFSKALGMPFALDKIEVTLTPIKTN